MSRRSAHRDPDADLFEDEDEPQHPPPTVPEKSNPYSSSTRWRHQESSSYAKHARQQQQQQPSNSHGAGVARDADSRSRVNDLADFLNTSRLSPDETTKPTTSEGGRPTTPRYKPVVEGAAEARHAVNGDDEEEEEGAHHHATYGLDLPPPDGKDIVCGPLINYRRMEGVNWVGSVLVVTRGGGREQLFRPTLYLRRASGGSHGKGEATACKPTCLLSDSRNTFWRFELVARMEEVEMKWEYELPELRWTSKTKPRVNCFFVPAVTESMRIMFHSCNGFSVGTDEEAWSGAALWNDVMRKHGEAPFHVM